MTMGPHLPPRHLCAVGHLLLLLSQAALLQVCAALLQCCCHGALLGPCLILLLPLLQADLQWLAGCVMILGADCIAGGAHSVLAVQRETTARWQPKERRTLSLARQDAKAGSGNGDFDRCKGQQRQAAQYDKTVIFDGHVHLADAACQKNVLLLGGVWPCAQIQCSVGGCCMVLVKALHSFRLG